MRRHWLGWSHLLRFWHLLLCSEPMVQPVSARQPSSNDRSSLFDDYVSSGFQQLKLPRLEYQQCTTHLINDDIQSDFVHHFCPARWQRHSYLVGQSLFRCPTVGE
jgi:hypothetical protein